MNPSSYERALHILLLLHLFLVLPDLSYKLNWDDDFK